MHTRVPGEVAVGESRRPYSFCIWQTGTHLALLHAYECILRKWEKNTLNLVELGHNFFKFKILAICKKGKNIYIFLAVTNGYLHYHWIILCITGQKRAQGSIYQIWSFCLTNMGEAENVGCFCFKALNLNQYIGYGNSWRYILCWSEHQTKMLFQGKFLLDEIIFPPEYHLFDLPLPAPSELFVCVSSVRAWPFVPHTSVFWPRCAFYYDFQLKILNRTERERKRECESRILFDYANKMH